MYHVCVPYVGACTMCVHPVCGVYTICVLPVLGLHVPCMCTLCDDYSLLLAGSPSDFLLGFCVMVWRSGSESSKAGWGFLVNKWYF